MQCFVVYSEFPRMPCSMAATAIFIAITSLDCMCVCSVQSQPAARPSSIGLLFGYR